MRNLICSMFAFFVMLTGLPVPSAYGQFGGNGGNGGQNFGGIIIDGDGVLETTRAKRISRSALKKLQQDFSQQQLDTGILKQSESRTISLKQLNSRVQGLLKNDESIPLSLRYLAGLQRVDFIVIDREAKDIFLVGPAEGFAPGPMGQIVGVSTGRPPMQLDDLVVALRATLNGRGEIGVSIDPTDENMARLQNYIQRNSSPTTTSGAERRYQMMGKILANQVISIWGVPEDSHFALAMAEADLRMKRISLGTEPSGVRGVRSHLSLLVPQGNSLQRWWFVPSYETINTNESHTVFQLQGPRAKLMSQEEITGPNGQRSDAVFTRKSTQKFAEIFSDNFEKLADANPAFAKLQSLYDLSLVAAIVRTEQPFGNDLSGIETLLTDEALPIESYPVPKFVKSASTYRKSSRGMLIGLIGGVTIQMNRLVQSPEVSPRLYSDRFEAAENQVNWWWNNSGQPTQKESSPR